MLVRFQLALPEVSMKKPVQNRYRIRPAILFSGLIILVLSLVSILVYLLNLPEPEVVEPDLTPPEISLNGDAVYTITVGTDFSVPEPTATDNGEEVEVVTTGSIDTSKVGNYILTYEATDASGNIAIATREVYVVQKNSGIVYLTFDDGPSEHTYRLLDVLKKYNVKATFFVTGSGDDAAILRAYQEGHTIALHSFTHSYSYIYQNTDIFFSDLYRIQERVKNITGQTVTLMRFPGGSSNTVSHKYDGGAKIMSQLVNEVKNRGFTYFDWNISSGDAGETTSTAVVARNVTSRLIKDGKSVVLQHDNKGFSVDAVESIIQYGLSEGYTFKGLDANAYQAHHRVSN